MRKFTSLTKKNVEKPKSKVVYDGYFKVIDYKEWTFMDEKDTVFCIPYFIEENQFVLRYESVSSFEFKTNQEFHINLVGGVVENGETPSQAITREMQEEAGIVIRDDYKLQGIKPLFIFKGSSSIVHLFIIPLSSRDYKFVEAKGDGSKTEAKSKSVVVNATNIDSIVTSDLMTEYMLLKLKEYLNIIK